MGTLTFQNAPSGGYASAMASPNLKSLTGFLQIRKVQARGFVFAIGVGSAIKIGPKVMGGA